MDKSFNDQELSDIMKEIEALEEDFTASEEKSASPVMEELAHMDESESVPVASSPGPASTSNVVSLETKKVESPSYASESASKSTGASTSMSFRVQGNLTLDLQFEIGGKTVGLEVTENGLTIEMEGGVKFTVPVTEKSAYKKAV